MAVQFIGTTSGSAINGGNVAITLPGPYLTNDCVVASVAMGTSATPTLSIASSSGATTLYTQIVTTIQSSNVRFGVFRHVIISTGETSISITGTAGTLDTTSGVVHIFRGVSTSTPEDVSATSTTGGSATPDSPSISPATFGAGIISVVALGTPISATLTAPSGFLNAQSTTASDTDPITIGQSWAPNGSTSPRDPGAWASSVSQTWASATVALRPAAVTWSQAGLTSADDLVKEARRVVINSY